MKELWTAAKLWLASMIRTFRADDASVAGITVVVTVVGQICSGLLPIIAFAVAVYQLRLQHVRLEIERLKLDQACQGEEEE